MFGRLLERGGWGGHEAGEEEKHKETDTVREGRGARGTAPQANASCLQLEHLTFRRSFENPCSNAERKRYICISRPGREASHESES